MDGIRDVMQELRPDVLTEHGLLAALRRYGKRFSQHTNVRVIVCGDDTVQRLPALKETALFRIAQEALTNVARHAKTDTAILNMTFYKETSVESELLMLLISPITPD